MKTEQEIRRAARMLSIMKAEAERENEEACTIGFRIAKDVLLWVIDKENADAKHFFESLPQWASVVEVRDN